MNESFSDLRVLGKYTTNKEIMTFFAKVKNFFRGKKNVSGKNISEGEGKDVLLLEFEPINN